MSNRIFTMLTVVATLLGGGLFSAAEAQPGDRPQHTVRVRPDQPPPAPRSERVRARRGFVWVAGHWDWQNGAWAWMAGHWERQRPGKRWRDIRWEQREDTWVRVGGEWIDPPVYPVEAPPPVRAERVRPRRGFAWVAGRWEWRDGGWVWMRGRWVRHTPGKRWTDGRWERQGDRYVWIEGTWIDLPAYPTAEPPPRRVERRRARRGFVWVTGHWDWRDGQYAWVNGHWERRRVGHHWRPDRWEKRGERYEWMRGDWEPDTNVAPQGAGWVLLGEKEVDGFADHDVIRVGRHEGAFTKLMLIVQDGELDLTQMDVRFGNRQVFSPQLKHYFRENERTRSIDLPGVRRQIKEIRFHYGNLPGGTRARVQVWGNERIGVAGSGVAAVGGGTIVSPEGNWDRRGWTLLGERQVEGGRRDRGGEDRHQEDRDVIQVGQQDGRFRKLMVVVEDSDLELFNMSIEFGNGQTFAPELKQFFRENERTRSIDLPGDARVIRRITFFYRNLPSGGRARVAVWGK